MNYQRSGRYVATRIAALAPDPVRLSPYARAALAQLRRGVGKEPGSVPRIWELTLAASTEDGSQPGGWEENAVHIALTQWAMHQQSKTSPMHNPARSFGEALRLLASKQDRVKPHSTAAYRRMMALASSRQLTGITTHARGLIGQLRSEGISFDYGRWADDLYALQVPGRLAEVQRRWGRDFYRLSDQSVTEQLDGTTNTETINHSEEAQA